MENIRDLEFSFLHCPLIIHWPTVFLRVISALQILVSVFEGAAAGGDSV